MKSYLLNYVRFIVIILGVGMKILEPQGTSDQKQLPLIQAVPISNEVCRFLKKIDSLFSFFPLPCWENFPGLRD